VSLYPLRGSSRTPKCQSAPLEEVEAETGATVCLSGSAPSECQKPTLPLEKFYRRMPMLAGNSTPPKQLNRHSLESYLYNKVER
jgi:hypothetical protein